MAAVFVGPPMIRPILYGLHQSVYTCIAKMTLEEKGVEYNFEKIDVFNKSELSPEYLAINPFARIPVLLDGDFSIYETMAITSYIDAAYKGPTLQPNNIKQLAKMNQCISMLDSYAYPSMIWPIFVERVSVPRAGGKSDEAAIAKALPIAKICIAELSRLLGDHQYLIGSELTLADIHAMPILIYFYQTREGQKLIEQTPNLHHWLKKVCRRSRVDMISYGCS